MPHKSYPGELLVGVDHAPPVPLCFGLPGTPDFRGFEVDLLHDLAARLGVMLRFTSALWSTILAKLQAGGIDLICTAATITDERRRSVDFSDPYFESDLAVVTRLDHPIAEPSQIARRRVGVRVATVAEDFVRRRCPPENIETFDLNVHIYEALSQARVDAVVDDRPIASHFARSTTALSLGPRLPGTGFQYGIVLAKGNDRLRLAVNGALAGMRRDGSLAQLNRLWFEESAG